MRTLLLVFLLFISLIGDINAQFFKKPVFSGMYIQWGYNRDWYTKSDIHFKSSTYDFTIYDVVAKDQPDFDYYKDHPFDITIPQNSYRIGVYLNKEHTHAIEINYDHAKYVQVDGQTLRMKGTIDGNYVDQDTMLDRYVVHVEHTNGANFYQLNYVGQQELKHNKKKDRPWATLIWKAGGGIVMPKSDIILFYKRLDNKYAVAGYIFSGEFGTRFYPLKNLFLEVTVKNGYANYVNAHAIGDGRINHDFWFGEVIGLIGYDINFGKKKDKPTTN